MKWLESMTLQVKLVVLTGVMVFAMIVLSLMGFQATSGWKSDVSVINDVSVPSVLAIGKMRNGAQRIAIEQNRVRALKDDPKIKDKMAESSQNMKESFSMIDEGYKRYDTMEKDPKELEAWNDIQKDYKIWRELSEKFNKVIDTLAISNDQTEIDSLFIKMGDQVDNMRTHRKTIMTGLQSLYDINKAQIKDVAANAVKSSTSYKQMFIIVAVISILVAITFAWLLIVSISRSIKQSVTSIRDGAMQITSASDQVASSSSSLAQGASEQASSVEEVSATLEESTAINIQNTDNARQADILAKNANDSARAGYQKGEQLSHSMHAITESAAKISGIIKTIDQIAFQTNLLALNAAVEAARAGEHGLGFAVVADEVRNLAQRAASAAKETSVIIEEVVGQIKEGNEIALATHTSFQEIVEQSKKVSDLIGEISIAGKEQSEGMAQINQAMGQVDQVTQQVAANSEEAAAAAEELNAQATSMMETVRVLANMVGMESSAPIVAPKHTQHFDMKALHVTPKQNNQAVKKASPSSKAEEIFPLHEDDLKEF